MAGEVVGPYLIKGTIGAGSFAKVKLAVNTQTGEEVAVKIFDRAKLQRKDEKMVEKEIAIMKMIHHRNVLELKGVLRTDHKIYVILELARGGDLFDQIVSMGKFDEDVARNYFQQLIEGVSFCHQQGVCHRDLKPDNLLLDGNGVLKISDFGLSAIFEPSKDHFLQTKCGSLACSAPEVVLASQYDGIAADVWSCGCILYGLLAGYLPFEEDVEMRRQRMGIYEIPDWISPAAEAFLRKLLVPEPSKRTRLEDMKKDPWFKRDLHLVQSGTYMGSTAYVEAFDEFVLKGAGEHPANLTNKTESKPQGRAAAAFAAERVNAMLDCLLKHRVAEPEGPEAESSPPVPLSDLHVLVVDDAPLDRLLVQRGLKKYHYKTSVAENGRKALQILKEKAAANDPIHLVLSDVVNPDMDGYELLRQIKQTEGIKDVPVIMVSSSNQNTIVEKCIKAGAADFFLKPVRLHLLKNIWQHVWNRKVLLPPEMAVDNMNVLVVDDQRVDREIVAKLLKNCQYKVTVAENGKQALEILTSSPTEFHLVLADVKMPDMDGYELLHSIRRHDDLAEIPVIMMSSDLTKDAVTEAIIGGADDFMQKPLRKMRLKELWQNVHFFRFERAEKNKRKQTKDVVDWKTFGNDPIYRFHCQEVAELQTVDVSGLPREESLAFFINMFNVLMIHGHVALGVHIGELGRNQRRAFFTGTSYQFGPFQLSLDDIEHGILRGNRQRPWSLKRQFAKSDPRCSLTIQDFDPRVVFTLSYLTVSSPPLTIYNPQTLESQLASAATLFCNEYVTVQSSKHEVTLPKVFQWYQADFGNSRNELLLKVAEWLGPGPKSEHLIAMVQQGSLNVKYMEYNWDLKVRTEQEARSDAAAEMLNSGDGA